MFTESIVIAPDWPGDGGGMAIAVRADLAACQAFFKRVHLITLSEKNPPASWPGAFPGINRVHIPIIKKPLWSRFARSLLRRNPAVAFQYVNQRRRAEAALKNFREGIDRGEDPAIIILDTPTGALIDTARRIFPRSPVAVHSHNVSSEAFAGFARRGNPLSRSAWSYELARIRRFEKRVAGAADYFWSISENDEEEYRRLGIRVDGVLGVYLDTERFREIPPGNPETVVHVGRIDLRKGRGMERFIRSVWPTVRRRRPDARLVLGGAGTEKYHDPGAGIEGVGFVEDEREILKRGMIFINPQIDGSGIQLKSAVAMLSGKLLVTTVTGGKGIAGEDPGHFWASDDPANLARFIIEAAGNPDSARKTALRGRAVARKAYDKDGFIQQARALFRPLL